MMSAKFKKKGKLVTIGKGMGRHTQAYILLVGSSFLEVSLVKHMPYLCLNHIGGISDQPMFKKSCAEK